MMATVRYVVSRLNTAAFTTEYLSRVEALFAEEEWVWTADRAQAHVWAIGHEEYAAREQWLRAFAIEHGGHALVASESDGPGVEVPVAEAVASYRPSPAEVFETLDRRKLA